MDFEQARFNMIEQQIRPWDVLAHEVLELLGAVRREDFVPAAWRHMAFADIDIPLACGQSMLSPKVEARMLQELAPRKHEHVLEIGTGSGFMAALLGHSAAQVTTLEIHAELADAAAAKLRQAGLNQVVVRTMDASRELPEGEFDAIMVSGSLAEVPQALIDKLRVGGRLVAIVGQGPMMRAQRLTRVSPQESSVVDLFDTVAPRLLGFAEPSAFRF